MYREYFISTPLLLAPTTLQFNNCKIVLLGHKDLSYVEGDSPEEVDGGFDFLDLLASKECLGELCIPSLSIQMRRNNLNPATLPKDPRKINRFEWKTWLLSQVDLNKIPVVEIDNKEADFIQTILNKS